MEIRSDTSSQGVGRETRCPASKEEILEEMVAKSTDSSVSSKDQLRSRVYSLLREVAHVPLSSPPRLKKTSSFFVVWFRKNLIKITGKRTGTKPRKRRTLRRVVISLH
jgi:hypothetical protein